MNALTRRETKLIKHEVRRCEHCDGGVVSVIRWPYDERPETPTIHHFINRRMPMRLPMARQTLLEYKGTHANVVRNFVDLLVEEPCYVCRGLGQRVVAVEVNALPSPQRQLPPQELPALQAPNDEEIIDAEFTVRDDAMIDESSSDVA